MIARGNCGKALSFYRRLSKKASVQARPSGGVVLSRCASQKDAA